MQLTLMDLDCLWPLALNRKWMVMSSMVTPSHGRIPDRKLSVKTGGWRQSYGSLYYPLLVNLLNFVLDYHTDHEKGKNKCVLDFWMSPARINCKRVKGIKVTFIAYIINSVFFVVTIHLLTKRLQECCKELREYGIFIVCLLCLVQCRLALDCLVIGKGWSWEIRANKSHLYGKRVMGARMEKYTLVEINVK